MKEQRKRATIKLALWTALWGGIDGHFNLWANVFMGNTYVDYSCYCA